MPDEKKVGQLEVKFFGPGSDRGDGQPVPPPSIEDLNDFLTIGNDEGVWGGFVGNAEALQDLSDVIFEASMKPNHCAGPNGIALIGPPSTGKTSLAKRVGAGLGTIILGKRQYKRIQYPFVECDRSIKSTADLFSKMESVYRSCGIPLTPTKAGDSERYKAPPGIIYFDEAQAIRGDWLLKATERNDATLITDKVIVDCKNILWILGTTHRGKLPKAFDTRFMKVFLYSYTLDQVSEMVKINNPDLPPDVCRKIAGYGNRVPREALDFAKRIKLAAFRMGTSNWDEACKVVSARHSIDEEGLTRQHLAVLVALYNNRNSAKVRVPMPLKRLADQVGAEEIDMEEYILPPVQMTTPDRGSLIRTSSRGIELTDEGIQALVRRGLIKKKQENFNVGAEVA